MLMKKVKLMIASLMILVAGSALAQNIRVSGTVTDSNGDPVPGAAVMLQGSTSVGTATLANGSYSLSVPSNGTLVVSSVGYKEASAPVNGLRSLSRPSPWAMVPPRRSAPSWVPSRP